MEVFPIIAPVILFLFCVGFVLCICCFVKLLRHYEDTQGTFTNQSGRRFARSVPTIGLQQPLFQRTASPTIVPPYPVEPQHPMPHSGGLPPPPSAGFATNQPPYPTQTPPAMPVAPYPPTTAPYPPPTGPIYPMGSHMGSAPYPPPTPDSPLPPSYQEAVSQSVLPQPPPTTRDAYNKQAPYNPHY